MGTTFQIEQQASVSERYARRVNPEWVRLLDLLPDYRDASVSRLGIL